MSYLNIKNPIDNDVKTGYEGEMYTVKAGATESFPEALAKRFVEIYPFMELVVVEKTSPKKIKEEVEEVKEVKEKEVKKKAKK